jgi:hypothetical protein
MYGVRWHDGLENGQLTSKFLLLNVLTSYDFVQKTFTNLKTKCILAREKEICFKSGI